MKRNWKQWTAFLCLLMLCAVPATAPAQAQAPRLDKLKVDVKRIEVDGQRMYEVDASGSATPRISLPFCSLLYSTIVIISFFASHSYFIQGDNSAPAFWWVKNPSPHLGWFQLRAFI